MLRRERHYGRRAAERRGHARAVEIIGAHLARRGELLDVAMTVDAARHDQSTARVQPIDAPQMRRDFGDEAVLDSDIGFKHALSRDHGATRYDEVERPARRSGVH